MVCRRIAFRSEMISRPAALLGYWQSRQWVPRRSQVRNRDLLNSQIQGNHMALSLVQIQENGLSSLSVFPLPISVIREESISC